MHYVYILTSAEDSARTYIGATADLKTRFADHNSGKSPHTSKFTPWDLSCYIAFPSKEAAFGFEKYLKSHSGRAFARKRLITNHQRS